MENQLQIEADVLWVGFDLGYFDKVDIERWADRNILAIEKPPTALLDLSILRHTDSSEVLRLLRGLGTSGTDKAYDCQIGFIGQLFLTNRTSLEKTVRSLYWICSEMRDAAATELSETEQQIYWLDDEYDLVIGGYKGALDNVQKIATEFMTPYANKLQAEHHDLLALHDN